MSAEAAPAAGGSDAMVTAQSTPDSFTRERWAWLKQVVADDDLTPFSFRVAFIVADHLNRESRLAWPSQERIGQVLKATRRGVQGALVQLEERGHLAVLPSTNRKGGNRYRLMMSGEPILIPPHMQDDAHEDDVHVHGGSHEDTAHVHGGAHESARHVNGGVHEAAVHAHGGAHENSSHAHRHSTVMRTAVRTNLLKKPVEVESESISAPSKPKRRPPTPKAKTSDDDFAAWWLQVPKAVGKADARRAYDKVILSGAATHAELIAGILRYAAERQGQDPQYTKHPATWLNKGCWTDGPAQPRPAVLDEPMTRTQASRSEARAALEAIEAGMDPDSVARGAHLTSKGRRMVLSNIFAQELRRRNSTHTENQEDAIIIDNDDIGVPY